MSLAVLHAAKLAPKNLCVLLTSIIPEVPEPLPPPDCPVLLIRNSLRLSIEYGKPCSLFQFVISLKAIEKLSPLSVSTIVKDSLFSLNLEPMVNLFGDPPSPKLISI